MVLEHNEALQEILKANEDLADRMRSLSYHMLYDREDDTLTVTFGEPEEAITESSANRMYLRFEPETLKIVGFEIPHVSKRLKDDRILGDMLRSILPKADLAGELRGAVLA